MVVEKARTDESGGDESRVAHHIKELATEMVRCLLQGDAKSLAACLDEGFMLRLPNGERVPKMQWLDLLSSGQIRYDSLSVECEAIHVYDRQVVFTSGHCLTRQSFRGQSVEGRFPYTALYVCRRGQWQIVAIHQLEQETGRGAGAGIRIGGDRGALRP